MGDQDFRAVEGLSHAAVRTKNIQDSIRYYTEILGLQEAFRMYGEDGSLATVYMILAPGQYLELFSGGRRIPSVGPDHPCFFLSKSFRRKITAVTQNRAIQTMAITTTAYG